MRILKLVTLFFLVFVPLTANSAQQPRFLGTEKKFRSYVYNPNDVYLYIGHYTYQGFIEFEGGETISTISMGNPSLWIFEHLGNRLFLKPVGEDNSETNMTVITNKRIYHFELIAKEAKGINDKDLIFVAKFVYPDEKDKNIVEFAKSDKSDEPDLHDLSIYNFGYQYTGEPAIAPLKVFDNGEFTYFQFPKKNAEIPAIFTVDGAGFESLVNFRSAGEYIIVERVAPQFTLRSGPDIVCIYNSTMYTNGKPISSTRLNPSGATSPNLFIAPQFSEGAMSQQNQSGKSTSPKIMQ
jgi:type IV secretion system protein VirB9